MLASVAVLALMAYWAFFSFVMLLVRCGDTCSNDADAAHWRYTAQFVLAVGSCLAGVVGVALAGALAWVLWVIGFGAF